MTTTREQIDDALRAHFARPDDPETTRALYALIAGAPPHMVDAAMMDSIRARPAVPEVEVVREPAPEAMPVLESIAGPRPEAVPAANWAGNIPLTGALNAFKVSDTDDVRATIVQALAHNPNPTRNVLRALGTTHSSSGVVATPGTIVDTGVLVANGYPQGSLRKVAKVDPATLRPGVDASKLYQVGSGLRVREVIAALNANGRALEMLGAYTGQTYVGALCTGTHGSGIQHGALHTALRAIELMFVDDTGQVVLRRIERSPGITDPTKVDPKTLIQDDGAVRAALVGVGSLGVVTSVVVETVAPYNLQADRIHRTWPEIRAILADVDANGYPKYFANTYTAGVLMNPYPWPLKPEGPRKGVINRGWIPAQPPAHPEKPTVAGGCDLLFDVARFLGNHTALTPFILNLTIDSMSSTTNIYGPWNEVLASSGNLPQGYSVEYSLPLSNYLPALDAIFQTMYDIAWNETKMLAGTLSIRFVKGDDAYLSMAEGRDSVFLEFLTLAGINAAPDVFRAMETTALRFGARPHWGQWFDLNSMPSIVPLYGKASSFRDHGLDRFDKKGAFANDVSKKIRQFSP
ncbi:MAG: hypothetical protein IT378_07150 [Sandaracinaceae bacterium]|nr:hypothetical protein [Sandaracinaceae bacterium]